jgi:DNA-binding transcriptional LysR family regulator
VFSTTASHFFRQGIQIKTMLRASFRQLQVFESVARHKSFTRAAEELFITQSTVSIQLKQLSDNLGVPLLEQLGKKIYITPAGESLLAHCKKIFSELNEMERDISGFLEKPQGRLRVSSTVTAQFFLPRVLGAFAKCYPEVDVSLQISDRPTIMERFANNQDDLYVLGRIPEDMDIKVIPFVENPLVLIASPDHPLANEKAIAFERIMKEPFLLREPGSTTLKEIEIFCRDAKIEINQKMILGGNEAIKQGVMGGLGISILSQFTVVLEQRLGLIAVLDVEGFPLQRQWYIGYPSGKQSSLASQVFLDFVRDQGRDIAKSCLSPVMSPIVQPIVETID